MGKKRKGTKIHNRMRKVRESTLENLYKGLNLLCRSCCYNSNCPLTNEDIEITECQNYKEAIELNTLIQMMKEQNIDIDAFCEKYGLKKEFFIEMMKGKMLMKYKYYYYLCKRLHIEEMDEFHKYAERFEEYQPESEVDED